jgi:hypothetical protein
VGVPAGYGDELGLHHRSGDDGGAVGSPRERVVVSDPTDPSQPPPRSVPLSGTGAAHASGTARLTSEQQLSGTGAARSGGSARLTVDRVTKAIRTDKRFLALVAILVVFPPILTWWIQLPGAAVIGIAEIFGVAAAVAGYKAISEVIKHTLAD